MISGHITITKIFSDGKEEKVLDKHNLVTAGLGSSFIDLLTDNGSNFVEDYSPRYFQLGTDTIGGDSLDTSAHFYRVSSAFDWDDYGPDCGFDIEERSRGFLASSIDGITYNEMINTSAAFSAVVFSGTDEYFGTITPTYLSKTFLDSFTAEIVLDENCANGTTISELGLFSKNPKGRKDDYPLLIAYKKFDPITKTEDFTIVVHWSVGFIGVSNQVDVVAGSNNRNRNRNRNR